MSPCTERLDRKPLSPNGDVRPGKFCRVYGFQLVNNAVINQKAGKYFVAACAAEAMCGAKCKTPASRPAFQDSLKLVY
jgi:hypothetical protein